MTKKAKQVRELGLTELKEKLEELKKDYAKEIVKSKTGARNEKAINLKNMRKDIARVLTIITEKEFAALNNEKKEESKPKAEKVKASTSLDSKKSSKLVQDVKVFKIPDAPSKNLTQSTRSSCEQQADSGTSSSQKDAVLTQDKKGKK